MHFSIAIMSPSYSTVSDYYCKYIYKSILDDKKYDEISTVFILQFLPGCDVYNRILKHFPCAVVP